MNTFMMAGIAVFVCGVAGCVIYDCLKFRKNARSRYGGYRPEDALDEAAGSLLRIADELEIIRRLRYEKACKEDLMQTVHQMFFFRQFKDPQDVCEELKEKMNQAAGSTCFTEENQAVAEMYRKIIEDINPAWLEGKKP